MYGADFRKRADTQYTALKDKVEGDLQIIGLWRTVRVFQRGAVNKLDLWHEEECQIVVLLQLVIGGTFRGA